MKVLLYHPFIPPYRVDLFNTLSERYETDIEMCIRDRSGRGKDFIS